jgi:nucleoside-diphosphate-sugar epimerase
MAMISANGKRWMSLEGRRVLVTGASGFIGSHLAEALVCAGARVTALTHNSHREDEGNLDLIDAKVRSEIEVVRGDLLDPHLIRAVTCDQEIIFHLGAQVAVAYSYAAPYLFFQTNAGGTFNVLEAARANNVARVVLASSSAVYGTTQYSPIDEMHPLQAQSPYAASKIAAEKIAESFYWTYDVPVVTVRPFNIFGPRQSRRALIPTIMGQLASRVARLRLQSLEPVRDFIFITDAVSGYLHLAQAADVAGGVFNLGSGVGVTVSEVAQRIMRITGRDVPIDCALDPMRRPGTTEVLVSVCDNKRLKASGWECRMSLDDGIEHLWAIVSDRGTVQHPAWREQR